MLQIRMCAVCIIDDEHSSNITSFRKTFLSNKNVHKLYQGRSKEIIHHVHVNQRTTNKVITKTGQENE